MEETVYFKIPFIGYCGFLGEWVVGQSTALYLVYKQWKPVLSQQGHGLLLLTDPGNCCGSSCCLLPLAINKTLVVISLQWVPSLCLWWPRPPLYAQDYCCFASLTHRWGTDWLCLWSGVAVIGSPGLWSASITPHLSLPSMHKATGSCMFICIFFSFLILSCIIKCIQLYDINDRSY